MRKLKDLVTLGAPSDLIEMTHSDDTGVLTLNLGKIDEILGL